MAQLSGLNVEPRRGLVVAHGGWLARVAHGTWLRGSAHTVRLCGGIGVMTTSCRCRTQSGPHVSGIRRGPVVHPGPWDG
jgi:hypothetical protein